METLLYESKFLYYIQLDATTDSGTLTVSGTPQYTIRKKSDGSTVTSWTGIGQGTTGGWNTSAGATVQAWYNFDTSSLTAGLVYVLGLRMAAVGSTDNQTRTAEIEYEIYVQPIVPLPGTVTYDITTDLGKVRFYLKDTSITDFIWLDAEIDEVLSVCGNYPKLAAAILLEAECSDRARSASVLRIGSFGDDESKVYDAMERQAALLRKTCVVSPDVISYDQVFSMDSDSGTTIGTMTVW